MNKDVIDYLKKGLRDGYKLGDLKQALLNAGHSKESIEESVRQISVSEASRSGRESPGIFRKLWLAFRNPNELYRRTGSEKILSPLKYETVISLLIAVITTVVIVLLILSGAALIEDPGVLLLVSTLSVGMIVFGAVLLIPIMVGLKLLIGLIGAVLVHMFIRLFRGLGGYSGTYKALMYATTPSTVFGFIPIVNFLAAIWSFVLMLYGLSHYHSITKLRAFLALLVFWAVVFAIVIVPTILLLMLEGSPARDLADRAAVKSELDVLKGQAAMDRVEDGGDSYEGFCSDPEVRSVVDSVNERVEESGGRVRCSSYQWGYTVMYYSDNFGEGFYCIDQTGFAGDVSSAPTGTKNCSGKDSSSTPPPDDWQTYANTKYGFEFKHPPTWNVEVLQENDVVNSYDKRMLAEIIFTESGTERMSLYIWPKERTGDAFEDGYERFDYFYGDQINERSIWGKKVVTSHHGCYECYEMSQEEVERISNQIISVVCNFNDVCMYIKRTNTESENAEDLFVDTLIPTLDFSIDFQKIRYTYQGAQG